MARVLAFNVFFFLLPFLLYGGYLLATRGSLRNAEAWQVRTVAWLAAGGIVLMLATLIGFGHFTGAPGDFVYRPARYEDGKLIPGELVPREEVADDIADEN